MTEKNNNISFFSVSFRPGFVSPNIPIATFYQGDKVLNFLLDSGSDKNIMDVEALKQFNYEIPETSEDSITHLSGIGGTQQVSVCKMTFSCAEDSYTTEFLVTDMKAAGFEQIQKEHCITIHGILGSAFLREHNIILDFKNLAAYSNNT